MQLEDLFEYRDILRLVIIPSKYSAVLTSIRLRFVSRRMQELIIAAGYSSGRGIVEYTETYNERAHRRHRSWAQVGEYVRAAFAINLMDPLFARGRFWVDIVPTRKPFVYSQKWKYHITECFTLITPRVLIISPQYAGRFIDAIFAALKHGRAWFVRVLQTFKPPDSDIVENAHYLLLEYALRHDDPSVLEGYTDRFELSEWEEVCTKAVQLGKIQVLAWCIEHPVLLNRDTRQVQVRIVQEWIAHGSANTAEIHLFQFVHMCHEACQTRKRKADAELVRPAEEVKQARIEADSAK